MGLIATKIYFLSFSAFFKKGFKCSKGYCKSGEREKRNNWKVKSKKEDIEMTIELIRNIVKERSQTINELISEQARDEARIDILKEQLKELEDDQVS